MKNHVYFSLFLLIAYLEGNGINQEKFIMIA